MGDSSSAWKTALLTAVRAIGIFGVSVAGLYYRSRQLDHDSPAVARTQAVEGAVLILVVLAVVSAAAALWQRGSSDQEERD